MAVSVPSFECGVAESRSPLSAAPILAHFLPSQFSINLEITMTSLCSDMNESYNGMSVAEWRALSDDERQDYQRLKRRESAYKTALCRVLRESGACPFAEQCRFAHTEEELRAPPPLHPKFKTVLCRNFSNSGCCRYGSRCQFIHKPLSSLSIDSGFGSMKNSLTTSMCSRANYSPEYGYSKSFIRKSSTPVSRKFDEKADAFRMKVNQVEFNSQRSMHSSGSSSRAGNRNIEEMLMNFSFGEERNGFSHSCIL